MTFNVEQQITRGRMKRLFELLLLRHHADPDPAGRARRDITQMLEAAFAHFAKHFEDTKSAALHALIDLQKQAFAFYEHVLGSRSTPDVARLERILREMDEELAKLSRDAGEIAESAPKFTPPGLGPRPPKAWDDPSLDFDEFAASYRARYPRSELSDPRNAAKLKKHYDAGRRLDPATGELKKPVVPLPPPRHINLPTDPVKIKTWADYRLGGEAPPCFPADTLVHVPAGTVRIDQMSAGDEVFAWDAGAGQVNVRRVVRVHRNWTTELVAMRTDRGVVHATRGHRFWTEDRSAWIAADEVRAGSRLRLRDGGLSAVIAAERVLAIEPTYNLEVSDDHTYFVAESGVLVHNDDASAFGLRDNARPRRIYRVLDAEGSVVYIGQTVKPDVNDRLSEHINDPDSALYIDRPAGSDPIRLDDPRNPYRIKQIVEGEWTVYEAAVWEQHYIDRYGGLKKDGGKLLNRQRALTPENFALYHNLHNPC